MLFCPKCKQEKTEAAFTKNANRKSGRHGHCKACKAAFSKEWARANRDVVNARARAYGQRIRTEMLAAYGGKCACCGESEPKFLALDHVNNDGHKERRFGRNGEGRANKPIAVKLRRLGFPQDGRYQLLCHNCNSAKGFYGVCPHTQRMSLYEPSAPYGASEGSDWFIQ